MIRRPPGSGSIEAFRGRFRARLPDEARTVVAIRDSREEAEKVLDSYVATSTAPRGDSLADYGPRWLDRRERSGRRHTDKERNRWDKHVASWECYRWPMSEIRRGDCRRWVDALDRADQTVRNALNLLRGCFAAALDDELIKSNPCAGLRVHARGRVEDPWTYLTPDEQRALLAVPKMPERLRYMIMFAIGTGLRWGEQRALQLVDVHTSGSKPHVVVRRSGEAKNSPKSKKHRRVPLFGLGLDAARWLENDARARLSNPRGLLCLPRLRAAYPAGSGPRLRRWLARIGIERRFRWHDLRHTCGSSLVAGWWGKRWPLIAVRDLLGHSTITITERYAHLAGSILEEEAAATRGLEL